MLGFIATTDFDWYTYLKAQNGLAEVNFWQPSGNNAFRAIPPGSPFFFKLKNPHYAICGFARFAHHSILPATLAWDSFGTANGAPTFLDMCARIEKYRREPPQPGQGYKIGCIILSDPVFFEPGDWVAGPSDWKPNIVRGATYPIDEGEGKRIFEQCLQRSRALEAWMDPSVAQAERCGSPRLVCSRLGQGGFRIAVMDAYERACAITTEHSLPVLEAAHIRPYCEGGEHAVSNGLLLRSDIHRLFDSGYVTVTPEHRFEVSKRLKEDFSNGKAYYALHGRPVHLPREQQHLPDPAMLTWHNSRFLG